GGGPPRPVPIKYVIGIVPPAKARDEALHARSLGFRTLKVKVGSDPAGDLARVAAVVDELQPGERVGVDANGGWSLPQALETLGPLAELRVAFLEQPVSARFPDAMAEVARRSPIPVVAHESVFSLRDGLDAVRRGIAHVWALTPSTHGGIVPT